MRLFKLTCYFLFLLLLFPCIISRAQENIAGGDKYIFKEDSVIIGPKIIDEDACYYWEPKELLNDNTLPNPMAGVLKTTVFNVTVTGKDFSYVKTGSMKVNFVKVESIEGLSSEVCMGQNITLKARLTDDISLPEGWILHWNGDGAKFGNQNGPYITAIFKEPNSCNVTKCWIAGSIDTCLKCATVVGFEVIVPVTYDRICDGTRVPLSIVPSPAGASFSNLICYSDFQLHSQPSYENYGNPSGTTTLTFSPLTNDLNSEIENARWYSISPEHCQSYSEYYIWATAKNNTGEVVQSPILNIEIDASSSCVQGYAPCCSNYFSGMPDIYPINVGIDIWMAEISMGTLKKDIINYPVKIITNPNSQFYDMTLAEELYHNKQADGTIVNTCYDELFIAGNIINEMKMRLSETVKLTEKESRIATEELFLSCMNNEINRSIKIFKTKACRCGIEYDAKIYLGEAYLFNWDCTYMQRCSDLNGDY